MRRHTPRCVTFAFATMLLFGCAEGHPLAPPSTADAARGASTLTAPSAVVAVAVSDNRIDLQWTDNSSNEARFEILRSTTGESGQFSLRSTTGANAVTYTDGSLQPTDAVLLPGSGRPADRRQNRLFAVFQHHVRDHAAAPAAAPSNVTVVAVSSGQVNVAWQDNSSDEAHFEIDKIYRDASGGTYTNTLTASANATLLRVYWLDPAWEYCFRVRAVATRTTTSGIFETDYSAYSQHRLRADSSPTGVGCPRRPIRQHVGDRRLDRPGAGGRLVPHRPLDRRRSGVASGRYGAVLPLHG